MGGFDNKTSREVTMKRSQSKYYAQKKYESGAQFRMPYFEYKKKWLKKKRKKK
jgi:hypothetical protein